MKPNDFYLNWQVEKRKDGYYQKMLKASLPKRYWLLINCGLSTAMVALDLAPKVKFGVNLAVAHLLTYRYKQLVKIGLVNLFAGAKVVYGYPLGTSLTTIFRLLKVVCQENIFLRSVVGGAIPKDGLVICCGDLMRYF